MHVTMATPSPSGWDLPGDWMISPESTILVPEKHQSQTELFSKSGYLTVSELPFVKTRALGEYIPHGM